MLLFTCVRDLGMLGKRRKVMPVCVLRIFPEIRESCGFGTDPEIDRQRTAYLGPRSTFLPPRGHDYYSRSQIDSSVCDMLGKLYAITTTVAL